MTDRLIETLNGAADVWCTVLWTVSWQFAVLFCITGILHYLLQGVAPGWRFWLWQILAIKLLLMPFWAASAPLLPIPVSAPLPGSPPAPAVNAAEQATIPRTTSTQTAVDVTLPVETPSTVKRRPRPRREKPTATSRPRQEIARPTEAPLDSPAKAPSPARLGWTDKRTSPRRSPDRAAAQRPEPAPHSISQPHATNETSPSTHQPSATSTAKRSSPVVTHFPLKWQAVLMLAWAAVVVLMTIRVLRQGRQLGYRLKAAYPADVETQNQLAAAVQKLELRRAPGICVVDLQVSPFVCGFWQPTMVLPLGITDTLTRIQFEHVVLHELAHLRRGDLVWGWIPEIAKVLFFFHPLVYLMAAHIRFERELACDQLALWASDRDPATYAETLIRVLTVISQSPSRVVASQGSTV